MNRRGRGIGWAALGEVAEFQSAKSSQFGEYKNENWFEISSHFHNFPFFFFFLP
jgi:hypothetical protein